jgi:Na+/H+-dicarboxylate symporter
MGINSIQQNEVVMLLLGVCVLIFIIKNRVGLNRLPECGILMTAFYFLLATWIATILESFIWHSFFNLIEHAGLAVSSVLTGIWCWKTFRKKKDTG